MPSAITIGNSIIYGETDPPEEVQKKSGQPLRLEETQHAKQAQVLGGAYLPAHLLSKAFGYAVDRRTHGPHDILEVNPHGKVPKP